VSPAGIVLLIVSLSALVVAHEWGHFIMARLFKIRVDDFSIGFGKRLLRLGKLGDTEYNIRAIPLGGFVKIAGMEPDEEPINRAKDIVTKRAGTDGDDATDDDPDSRQIPLLAENMEDPNVYDGPDGFNSKPLWQRSLVILGGPVMSFITGVAIFCLVGWAVGVPMGKPLPRVTQVEPDGEGHRIGLRAGDTIIRINGVPITTGTQMIDTIHGSLGKTVILTIKRNDEIMTLKAATPRPYIDPDTNKPIVEYTVANASAMSSLGLMAGDKIGTIDGADVTTLDQINTALIKDAGKPIKMAVARGDTVVNINGIAPANIAAGLPQITPHQVGILNFSPDFAIVHMSFKTSVLKGLDITKMLFIRLGQLVKTKQIHKAAGGIVAMANMMEIAQKDGPSQVLLLAAQISISLAIFNMLPIPILDGGHLLSFFIEWIRRGKRMAPQMQNAFMLTGLAIIAVLVVLITGKDIWNAIRHNVPQ